jgi:hypothetical protein
MSAAPECQAALCREKASERWRPAHGIMTRRPAQRPWLAKGISRSTWYRRRKQAREPAALAIETSRRREVLSRAEAFTRQSQAALAEVAQCQAAAAAVIGELSRVTRSKC